MLLIDDILFSPVKGVMWIFRQIHELAEDELAGEADRIRESLTDLYMLLETGQITEDEFEQQEAVLLDRLDALDEEDDMLGDEPGDDEDDEYEEDDDEEDDDEEDDDDEDDDDEDDDDEEDDDDDEDDDDEDEPEGTTK
ncbi:gas vesicle protein GvpG [Prodigiosinella confusarubida]|uniref:GvpG n=1 Tax=Serratia sp. (strain ATCC 39006) TaxID=104623 RepID=M9WPV0_SERS3|nr:gas vesicle protein GvpG [Serratia sp. ATCC 39006]AGJ98296.1 GvpG [Serratia sp. ATCC 39006]AUG98570.1 gas vesicle protein GvpG [Serratia sp. ATCC 39006]AUH02885.1 gas vesicle protein GvpG [Serratia sp. ATCC 39006]